MNAFYSVLACAACMLLWADVTNQMVQESASDDNDSGSSTTEINVPKVDEITEGQSQNCSTARGLAGSCVQRQYCEFSTYAIDLTLYMPRGYKRPCAANEVCCPTAYQRVAAPAPDAAQADDAFAFDADD